ncbi:MAG: GNAT family N-acetyltransferase [Ilumatobacteraceae bacterium]
MSDENRPSRVAIRRAEPTDLETLLVMVAEYCAADHHDYDIVTTRSALAPLLADDRHGSVWLIVDDSSSDPVGYACVTWGYSIEAGGPEALFDEIYVRQQGSGIGTVAMRLVLEEVRRLGYARIYLETETHNERGRRLYQRLGFITEDSVWMSLDWRE